jgi:hypothetical protein
MPPQTPEWRDTRVAGWRFVTAAAEARERRVERMRVNCMIADWSGWLVGLVRSVVLLLLLGEEVDDVLLDEDKERDLRAYLYKTTPSVRTSDVPLRRKVPRDLHGEEGKIVILPRRPE